MNVGGTILSSAALIYVCVSPVESAVCLVLCVCVCVCAVPWSRNQMCHASVG